MSSLNSDRQQAIETMRGLFQEMQVAMLTTMGPDNKLRSRPMIPAKHEFDGDLWFFALDTSPQVGDIERHPAVNVARAGPTEHQFVSICGAAIVVRDRQKLELLWNDALRSWFAEGWETPHLVLLRVAVEEVEYWDERVSSVGGLLSAMVSWRGSFQQVHEKILWKDATGAENETNTGLEAEIFVETRP